MYTDLREKKTFRDGDGDWQSTTTAEENNECFMCALQLCEEVEIESIESIQEFSALLEGRELHMKSLPL
jgi:hypothetical protein